MLEPKTKILIVKSPGRFPSVVARGERRYGAHGWSAIHFRRADNGPCHRDEDAAAAPSSQRRHSLPGSLRRDERDFPGPSRASRPAEYRRRGPRTREWWEYRPGHSHTHGVEYA